MGGVKPMVRVGKELLRRMKSLVPEMQEKKAAWQFTSNLRENISPVYEKFIETWNANIRFM